MAHAESVLLCVTPVEMEHGRVRRRMSITEHLRWTPSSELLDAVFIGSEARRTAEATFKMCCALVPCDLKTPEAEGEMHAPVVPPEQGQVAPAVRLRQGDVKQMPGFGGTARACISRYWDGDLAKLKDLNQ